MEVKLAVPTDAEARAMATKLMQLNVDARTIKQQQDKIKEQLTIYVKETGATEIGEVVAYEQSAAPTLVSQKGEKSGVIQAKLLAEIEDDFIIEKLDVKKIKEDLNSNKHLKSLMRRLKIEVQQKSSYRFKHVS